MAADDKEQNQVEKGWSKRIGRVQTWIIGVGTTAGALAAVFTLVFMLVPGWQPTQPSTDASGTLSNLAVVPNISLREYLQRPSVPEDAKNDAYRQFSEEDLAMVGNVIIFDATLKGYAQKACSFRWSVYDESTGKPANGLDNQPAWPWANVMPRHQSSSGQYETWVPLPQSGTGPFFVYLEVVDDETKVPLNSGKISLST